MKLDFGAVKGFADTLQRAYHEDPEAYSNGKCIYNLALHNPRNAAGSVMCLSTSWEVMRTLVEESTVSARITTNDVCGNLLVQADFGHWSISACLSREEVLRQLGDNICGAGPVDVLFQRWVSCTSWGTHPTNQN